MRSWWPARIIKGYWRKPGPTAEVMLPGGWLRTGDGGSFDADGYLYLHDRLTDMIVTGGENVYPAEVESVLTGHPAVAEVMYGAAKCRAIFTAVNNRLSARELLAILADAEPRVVVADPPAAPWSPTSARSASTATR